MTDFRHTHSSGSAVRTPPITVIHGANADDFDRLAGADIRTVRASLANAFNIPKAAVALVNGSLVRRDHRLRPAEIVEFLLPWGRKSSLPEPDEPGSSLTGLSLIDENGFPKEVGTAEAARILGVSKDTVLKLKAAGLLEYRNMAPPTSCRPVYAFSLRSVVRLRTTYETDEPAPPRPREPSRRAANSGRKYKHLKVDY